MSRVVRDPAHAETLFYLWLRTLGPIADVDMYDLLRESANIREPHVRETASLFHYVLTALGNLGREAESHPFPGNIPLVSRLQERLKMLGFLPEEVWTALRRMSAHDRDGIGTVEIYVPDAEDTKIPVEKPDVEVRARLTQLGARLVGHVSSKVGYAWPVAFRALDIAESWQPDDAYARLQPAERAAVLLRYVCTLAASHLALLSGVKQLWERESDGDWLRAYRQYFGVRERLQVERLYEEAAKFFAPALKATAFVGVFDDFGGIYQEALRALSQEEDWEQAYRTGVGGLLGRFRSVAMDQKGLFAVLRGDLRR